MLFVKVSAVQCSAVQCSVVWHLAQPTYPVLFPQKPLRSESCDRERRGQDWTTPITYWHSGLSCPQGFFYVSKIGHVTVVYSVPRPINGSKAAGDLVLIQASLFYHVNRVVVMLTSLHLHTKSKEICIKTRSPAA